MSIGWQAVYFSNVLKTFSFKVSNICLGVFHPRLQLRRSLMLFLYKNMRTLQPK